MCECVDVCLESPFFIVKCLLLEFRRLLLFHLSLSFEIKMMIVGLVVVVCKSRAKMSNVTNIM